MRNSHLDPLQRLIETMMEEILVVQLQAKEQRIPHALFGYFISADALLCGYEGSKPCAGDLTCVETQQFFKPHLQKRRERWEKIDWEG